MAWAEARGRKYRGCYRDPAGKKRYIRGTYATKKEAKGKAEEQEAHIRNGTWFDPDSGKISLDDYFEKEWLPNRNLEVNSVIGYRSKYASSIKPTFGHLELRQITPPLVQRWVIRMTKDGATPGTVIQKYKLLSAILGAQRGVSAVRDGLIARNPCLNIDLPTTDERVPDPYTVAESDSVLQHMPAGYGCIALLAGDTGMRWSELMGLEVRDFSEDYHHVRVERAVVDVNKSYTQNGTRFLAKGKTKNGKAREFDLSPEGAAMVGNLVKVRKLFPGDRLLSQVDSAGMPVRTKEWPSGLPVSRGWYRVHVWIPAHSAAGVRQRRFHDLRASHISWLLAGGLDVVTVMKRVGHGSLAVTQRYVNQMEDANERALIALQDVRRRARQA